MHNTDEEQIRISKQMGMRLKTAREALGLTQAELARAIDASQPQIDQYERGNLDMRIDRLFQLAGYLKISPEDLFGDN